MTTPNANPPRTEARSCPQCGSAVRTAWRRLAGELTEILLCKEQGHYLGLVPKRRPQGKR